MQTLAAAQGRFARTPGPRRLLPLVCLLGLCTACGAQPESVSSEASDVAEPYEFNVVEEALSANTLVSYAWVEITTGNNGKKKESTLDYALDDGDGGGTGGRLAVNQALVPGSIFGEKVQAASAVPVPWSRYNRLLLAFGAHAGDTWNVNKIQVSAVLAGSQNPIIVFSATGAPLKSFVAYPKNLLWINLQQPKAL